MTAGSGPQRDAKNGTWWFVVDLGPGPGPDGRWRDRRQAKRRGFKTRRAAQEVLDNVRVSARQHTYVAPTQQTVSDFLDEWLVSMEPALEATTHESYARNISLHVKPTLGGLKLQQVDAGSLNRLYAALLRGGRVDGKGGLSPRSVRYIATILHSAFGAAVKWDRLVRNPADAAEPPSARRAKASAMKTWTATELRDFLRAEKDDRHHPIWLFLATTGCRRGEALGLRWVDVDLGRGTATIRQTITVVKGRLHRSNTTKTGDTRVVRLDAGTVAGLKAWKKRQAEERLQRGGAPADEGLVFAMPDGAPIHPNSLSWRFEQSLRRHGLPRIRLHDLRHTWATLALTEGVHARVVQERLGHSSISVTLDIYSHVNPGLESDAAERVAGLFLDG